MARYILDMETRGGDSFSYADAIVSPEAQGFWDGYCRSSGYDAILRKKVEMEGNGRAEFDGRRSTDDFAMGRVHITPMKGGRQLPDVTVGFNARLSSVRYLWSYVTDSLPRRWYRMVCTFNDRVEELDPVPGP